MTTDGKRLGGLTWSPEVLDEIYAKGMTDDDIADAALDAQLYHSRLTRQQRRALKRETKWFEERDARGLSPTPEEMWQKAPNLLRMFAEFMDEGTDS